MNKILITFYHSIKRTNKQGLAPIWVRVTVNGDAEQRSTGIFAPPGSFSKKSLEVSGDQTATLRIRTMKNRMENQVVIFEAGQIRFGPLDLLNDSRNEVRDPGLLQLINDFLEIKAATVGKPHGIVPITLAALKNRAKNIRAFVVSQQLQNIRAKDVDQRFTEKLYQWLIFEHGVTSKEFAGKHIILLKSVLKQAVIDRKIETNPVQYVSPAKDAPKEILMLTTQELEQIKRSLATPSLTRVRDLFLFMCYTGLSYADGQRVNTQEIYSKNSMRWIRINRQKTGTVSIVPILPEAEAILNKYNGITPQISNSKFNLYLKALAAIAGIDKPITTHTARKTFACIALERGISMDAVSAMLGHSSIKTTQRHYGKVLEGRLAKELLAG